MIERDMAINNTVLKVIVGSNMYGTSTPDSDMDYIGVFIPEKDYVLGTLRCEQCEIKTNPSSNPKANTKDDVDTTIYSLPKIIHMLTNNNPTALEVLFAPNSCITQCAEAGGRLIANRDLFISQKAKYTYCGYAHSQLQKVLNKSDRYSQFVKAFEQLEKWQTDGYKFLPDRLTLNTDLISAGSWRIVEKGTETEVAIATITKELSAYGRRLEQVKELGFDPKFICHVVRLLDEGIELLKTGRITLPIPSATLVRDIKLGKHQLPWILKQIDEREAEIEAVFKDCKLQHSPDIAGINKLQIELLEEFYYKRGNPVMY